MSQMPPLAVHRRRTPGETVVAYLDGATPPLAVEFEVPDGLASAEVEAAASEAMSVVRRTPGYLTRYGMAERAALTDLQVAALARTMTAIEAAIRLWKDWNYAEVDEAATAAREFEIRLEGRRKVEAGEMSAEEANNWLDQALATGPVAVKAALTPENIAHVLSSANLRAAWMVQLDANSPVERAEGNAYAVSADTISAAAADTAPTADGQTFPAPEDSPSETESSAPG